MKYSIKKLAELAGVSTRTLRYYDEIDLLKPSFINEKNYRIYNEKNVNKLQQILFYRSLDFPLHKIKKLMDEPDFSRLQALQEQRKLIIQKQAEMTALLTNIDQTINDFKGAEKMTDSEKFKAFKQEKMDENETRYGTEIRDKYGSDEISKFNLMFSNISENDYLNMKKVEKNLIDDLCEFKKEPDLKSVLAEKIYQEHKEWLRYTWPNYTKEAHRGLVDMYVADERFASYYNDKAQTEVVKLLHDVVYQYTNK